MDKLKLPNGLVAILAVYSNTGHSMPNTLGKLCLFLVWTEPLNRC